MASVLQKVTVNVPAKLLERARATTGRGITETIVMGLEELERRRRLAELGRLRGKVRFELDLQDTRK